MTENISNNPKVSVIVPVYKAEKYLHRCIDSLVNQTLKDIEIILVDDGSPDNSGIICDEYASRDSRIKVIHKENGGVSSARNVGIENARGEYSIHCDSDDYVESNAYELLYDKAKETNADMVVCDFYHVKGQQKKIVKQTCYVTSFIENLLQGLLHGSTWNKLIKTSLFQDKNLRCNKKLCYCEDQILIIQLFLKKIRIETVSMPLYHYILSDSSITNKKIEQIIPLWNEYFTILSQILLKTNYSNLLLCQKEYMKRQLYLCSTNYSTYKTFYPEITKKQLIKNTISIKTKCRLYLPFYTQKIVYKIFMRLRGESK